MIHYTCDRCHNEIDLREETRYELQIDIRPVVEPSPPLAGHDDDSDHLLELHELLERVEEEDPSELLDEELPRRYDLCPRCYEQFRKNPVGRGALVLGFSDN